MKERRGWINTWLGVQAWWRHGRPFWFHAGFLALLFIVGAVEFARGALFISILPAYITEQLGYGVGTVGLVISAHYLMDTLFRSPAGWLVDRVGPWAVLLLGLPIAFAGILILSTHQPEWVLILAAALFGVGAAPTWPAVVSNAVSMSPEAERGGTLSTVFVAWLVGSGIGTVLVNFVVSHTYREAFWLLGGVFSLAILVTVAMRLLRRTPVAHTARPLPAAAYFRQMFSHLWTVRALLPGTYLQTACLGLLLPVLLPYAKMRLGLDQAGYGTLLMVGGGVTVLLLTPMGRLADRWDYRFLLTTGFVVAAGALTVLTFLRHLWTVYIFAAVLGGSYAMILPSWNALLAKALPEKQRGSLFGLFQSLEGLGIGTGPLIGGKLWEAFSPQIPFYVAAAALVVMAAFYMSYPLHRLFAAVRAQEIS